MSHVAIHVQKHLTPSNQIEQRRLLVRSTMLIVVSACMYLYVLYTMILFSFTDVVHSVGINYFSI